VKLMNGMRPTISTLEISTASFFGMPNFLRQTEPPVPPPVTQFFSYTVRKHFNLRLSDWLFDETDPALMEEGFSLAKPQLFRNREERELSTEYDAPIYEHYENNV